jgi:hypothetical protein
MKQLIIPGILILIFYFGIKRYKAGGKMYNFNETDFKNAVVELKKAGYKYEVLAKLEQLYRLETGNFKSGQYKACGSPGMEIAGNVKKFPYGWKSVKTFYEKFKIKPYGISLHTDIETKEQKYFIVWNSVKDACFFTVWFIVIIRMGKYEAWNSTDPVKAAKYKIKVDKQKNTIVNSIFAVI